jgi:hypothetical protein
MRENAGSVLYPRILEGVSQFMVTALLFKRTTGCILGACYL